MDIPKVEGMNMLEEHEHPSNHQTEEDGTDMGSIHMVEVEGMDMVEELASIEGAAGGGGYEYRGYEYGEGYDDGGGCGGGGKRA
jgi:hypothetical protein